MRDYAMFSEAGNDAVDAIVRTARILKLDWPQVYNELSSLAERFPVRECVYDACGFNSPFYI
jgi:hypothetical protein